MLRPAATLSGYRLLGIVALIVLLSVLATTSAHAADPASGVHGRFSVTDRAAHAGATCTYTPGYPNHYLVSLTVRAPRLWWPNLSGATNTEHGNVAWWPTVQRKSGNAWHTVASGTSQQAVAYEDHPKHDPADSAPLTSQTVAWAAGDPDAFRVVVKGVWYAADSSVMGQFKHTVKFYRLAFTHWSSSSTGNCSGRLTILT